MSRGTTVKECKSFCNEGCGAIEWWEGGGQACYLCTDLSLLIEFPYTRDLSYPPHVFIKQSGMSGCVLFFSAIFITHKLARKDLLDAQLKENKVWPRANRLDVKETRYNVKGMKMRTYQVITSNDITRLNLSPRDKEINNP